MAIEAWLLITALLFTFVGYRFGRQKNDLIMGHVIDHLIEEGFLLTEEKNGETHIVKR